MIRATLITDKEPIALIGISDQNLKRLKAGMPLDINLEELRRDRLTRIDRVIVHYAHTYEEVIDDLEKEGMPVDPKIRKFAKDLDAEST